MAIFTLRHFEKGMRKRRHLSPTRRMRALLDDPYNQRLFDESFVHGTFSSLLGVDALEDEAEWRARHRQHVEYEINFALFRLAFIEQKEDDRLGAAEIYVEVARPEWMIGLSVSERYKGYRDRAAFLVAAHYQLPSLLEFGEDIFLRLDAEMPDSQTFTAFCAQARAVASRLGSADAANVGRWTGIEPSTLPELQLIPGEVIDAWVEKLNRPAEETAVGKANRQKPVTEGR